jgi:hypothetical protein
MFTNVTIMAALFTIAIASSLIVVSSGLVGFAFAARKTGDNPVTNTMAQPSDTDNSNPPNMHKDNSGGLRDTTGSTDDTFAKDLKKFSKCLTGVAADSDLTLVEVTDCYHQVF